MNRALVIVAAVLVVGSVASGLGKLTRQAPIVEVLTPDFKGDENAPENYLCTVQRMPGHFYSPRHRHGHEQIRFHLEAILRRVRQ